MSVSSIANGPLRVSPDGRQLCHADGTPFFWLADTAWEIATRMRFDAETPDGRGIEWYLRTRAAQGFNVIQAPVITPLGWIAGKNVAGDSICHGDGFAPERLNENYLRRFDRVLDAATACGLFVAVLPAWAENVANGGINAEAAEKYGQILGRRFAHRTNLVWNLGGDFSPAGVEPAWDAMARGIARGVHGTSGKTPDFRGLLFTYHPKGHQSSSAYTLGEWMGFHSVQSSHTDPTNDAPGDPAFNAHFDLIERDVLRTPAKPAINTEPPYEDITLDLKQSADAQRLTPYDLRLAAYWSVLGGAAGHTYGHNSIWQAFEFGRGFEPQFGARAAWPDVLDTVGLRELLILRDLVLSRPLVGRRRDTNLIANFDDLRRGRTARTAVACRGDNYALAYSGNGSSLDVRMNLFDGKRVAAWWFDPRTGAATSIGTFADEGVRPFTPPGTPGDDNDWVLALSDAAADHPPPGRRVAQPRWDV